MTAVPACAQSTTGSIYGTVTDSSGAVIPNAAVTVVQLETNETHATVSNASGNYVFPSLVPGNYTVSAKASGYESETQTNIHLDANQNVHAIFGLKVGAITQSVTVQADVTMVDTRESQLGSTIDQARLEQLPLNGRNAYDLVTLSPGVTSYSAAQNSAYVGDPVGATFSTNGLRDYENSFYLDGANNTSFYRPGGNYAPNPDALLEFRILTSNFDAEFGTMPGAVVNMVTRSGTNNFHGLAYDFDRNTIFNAKTWPQSTPQHMRYNQFGGNFGGPILHDKLFAFGSYQGLRYATNAVLNASAATLPTGPNGTGPGKTQGASPLGERNGDFSTDEKIPKCGPNTYPCGGTPGVIPTNLLDTAALNVLKSLPVPATMATDPNKGNIPSSGGLSAQQTMSAPVTNNQYLARVDYQLNNRHKLSDMFFFERGSQSSPTSGGQTVLGYAGDVLEGAQTNDVGTDTWIISPTMLNSLRAYYSGNHYHAADLYAGQRTMSDMGISIPCAANPCTQPNFRIPGFIMLGNSGSAPAIFGLTTLGAADTFYWTHGNHTVKMGGAISRNKFADNGVGQRAGIYTFGGGDFTGNPLADFMLGKVQTFQQNNSYPFNLHQWDPSVFAQDDWRVSHRLTLNLGVRWEVFEPFYGEHNMGTFAPNVQSQKLTTAPLGVLFNGDHGVPDGVLHTSYLKFAPRLGFALDVFGNGKTSIRSGVGLFYSQVAGDFYQSLISSIYQNQVQIADAKSIENPYAGSTTPTDPFPFTPNVKNPTFPAGLAFPSEPANNSAVPYVYEYNLTLEHQISSSWSAAISYVGNESRKLYSTRDQNAPIYHSSCTTATCGTAASKLARRWYKPSGTSYVFNAIDEYYPGGTSNYNSLQAMLTKRLTKDFSINASYVWSKVLAAGTDPTANPITTFSASDEYNFKADYGRSGDDMPQRFVASYLWVSPRIHVWGVFGNEALSGWRISGITTLSTGTPFNIVSGTDSNFDGLGADRPNQVADWHMPAHRSRTQKAAEFFNTAAFQQVPVGTATGDGNTQINLMNGPGKVETALAAAKDFTVRGENQMQFRCDAFNAFSNVNLGNPAAQLNNPSTLGVIRNAAPGRVLQLSLKYKF